VTAQHLIAVAGPPTLVDHIPELSATALLIIGVVAFWRGTVVPRWLYDREREITDKTLATLSDTARLLAKAEEDVKRGKALAERLMAELKRAKGV
jgi:hypothetical protein